MRYFTDISTKTKILMLAILLVILPSGFLGYLGFRSIEYRGFRLKSNYQGIVQLLKEKMDGTLISHERRFLQDMMSQNWDEEIEIIQNQLGQILKQDLFVGDVFLMDVEGRIIHPEVILNTKAAAQQSLSGIQSLRNELINSGERYELSEKNYPMAIRLYRQAIKLTTSHQIRSYAHMLIARCYIKMQNYIKAEEEYIHLTEDGKNVYSSDGTPLRIIGLFQLSEAYGFLGQDQKKCRSLLELYRELISTPWGFDSYDFYMQTVKDELNQIVRSNEWDKEDLIHWGNLKKDEEVQSARVRHLEAVQRNLLLRMGDVSTAESRDPNPSAELTARHLLLNSNGSSVSIGYIPLPLSNSKKDQQVLVYQVDEEFVMTDLLSNTENNANLGNNIRLGLYMGEESLAHPSAIPPPQQALASTSLSQFFPSWSLVLFDKKGKSVEQIVRKEKQLYGAILAGVFGLILIGAIMTLKAAIHETEVARLKSEFISNVSHELRTPIALIRLFGETLELDEIKDPEKRKKFSRIISRESQRLSHLIENVLDFSKIDTGRKEYILERADLVEVVSSTLEAYRFYLKDQGYEFVVSYPQAPVYIRIDKDAISQAVLNLLDNAVKYSKGNKYISVEVSQRDGEIWISVEDKGSGIPESSLKHIFDKFNRGGYKHDGGVQGSGLGLTIVKHIVESHGGEITAESELGHGSRFTIKLPVNDQKGANPPFRGEQ
ncbi:MAG: ATP-binding protein [Candidatus Aminicenantes bacterium]